MGSSTRKAVAIQSHAAPTTGVPFQPYDVNRGSFVGALAVSHKTIRFLGILTLAFGLLFATSASAESLKARSASISFAGSLKDLDMVSASVGWALSYWDPPTLGVVRTANGGRTWRFVGPASARDVFECANHPWGAGFALFALNAQTAWLAAHCDGAGRGTSKRVNIWRTTTAGAGWTKSTFVDNTFFDARELALDFANSTSGWVGPESMDSSPGTLEALFRTEDGGAHWTVSNVLGQPVGNLLGFATQNVGYGYDAAPSGPLPNINTMDSDYSDFSYFPYVTRDGGGFWEHERVPIPPGFVHAWLWIGTLGNPVVDSPYDPSGTSGFTGANMAAIPVAGATGSFDNPTSTFCGTYHTRDGGTRWWYVMSKQVCPAQYLNASVGWGVPRDGSQNSLYRTVDGGYHWTLMGHSRYFARPGEFTFVTRQFGSSLARAPWIHVTYDGGRSWVSIYPKLAA